jgi:ketoreductase RED2
MKDVTNRKVVLITGSSSGLGASLADKLIAYNYVPIITYRHHETEAKKLARRLSKKLNCEIICKHLDVANETDLAKLHDDIMQIYGRLDTLVCNAGSDFYHARFQDIELREWQEVFGAKVFGAFNSVSTMLPLLSKSDNANIIMVSASLGTKPDPFDPVYSSACAALNNFAQSLVYSLSSEKIRTNTICPGPMDTGLSYWNNLKQNQPDIFKSFQKSNPMNVQTDSEHIAKLIMAIDDNVSLNGNVLYATGGSHLR